MGCRIFVGHEAGFDKYERAILFCSTTDWAFGPIFYDYEEARAFLSWLGDDPRKAKYTDNVLEAKVAEFRAQRGER